MSGKSRSGSPSFLKTTYLFAYNGLVSLWWWAVFADIVYAWIKQEHVAAVTLEAITTLQLLCSVDIVNAILGITSTALTPVLLQQLGRLCILIFVVGGSTTDVLHSRVADVLVTVYAAIEIVRYPHYVFTVIGKDLGILRFLRYNMFIPLYPVGIFCECAVIYLSLDYYSTVYLVKDPIAVPVAYLEYAVLGAMPFIANALFGNMMRQRRRHLGSKKAAKTA